MKSKSSIYGKLYEKSYGEKSKKVTVFALRKWWKSIGTTACLVLRILISKYYNMRSIKIKNWNLIQYFYIQFNNLHW